MFSYNNPCSESLLHIWECEVQHFNHGSQNRDPHRKIVRLYDLFHLLRLSITWKLRFWRITLDRQCKWQSKWKQRVSRCDLATAHLTAAPLVLKFLAMALSLSRWLLLSHHSQASPAIAPHAATVPTTTLMQFRVLLG